MPDQETVSLDDIPIELPPHFEQLLAAMKNDRRNLMKDKAFQDPAQLRMFMATTQMVRVEDAVRSLAAAMMDIYAMTAANAQEMQSLRRFSVDELNRLGADIDDDYEPGVSPELLDDFQQAFFALGSVLRKKLPKDEEAQAAYNLCAKFMAEITQELMYGRSRDEDGDDEDDDEDEDEREESKEDPQAEAPQEEVTLLEKDADGAGEDEDGSDG